jgi:hypothetical protein
VGLFRAAAGFNADQAFEVLRQLAIRHPREGLLACLQQLTFINTNIGPHATLLEWPYQFMIGLRHYKTIADHFTAAIRQPRSCLTPPLNRVAPE